MSEFWSDGASYRHCRECAEFGQPTPSLALLRAEYVGAEIDQWVERPTCYPVMCLLRRREDFTRLAEEGQRMFLMLAAEVLYGPKRDHELRAECFRIASEPV